MALATVTNGSMTGPASLSVQAGQVYRNSNIQPVNVSGDGPAFAGKFSRWFNSVSLDALWEVSGDFPIPTGGTFAGGPFACITRAQISKQYVLRDVSCGTTPNGTMEGKQGIVRYGGTVFGFLGDAETGILAGNPEIATLTLPLDATRSISGKAMIQRELYRGSYAQGADVGSMFGFVFTGEVTLAGTSNPFTASSFATSIDLDNGETHSGNILVRSLSAAINYAALSRPSFRVQGPATGTWTVA